MANTTLNGYPIMKARVLRPRVGLWTAELVADAQTASQLPQGGTGTLVTNGGTFTFKGTILRGDAYAQNVTLRMVGGQNGLGKLVTPRFYRGVQVSQPLNDALKDAGESLSGTSIPEDLATQLPFWSMVQQSASEALSSLADAAGGGCVWRTLVDGTVFFGVDGFAQSALTDFELIDYMPLEGIQVIASEAPKVNPGETFNGRPVSVVEHFIADADSRVRIWFE